MGVHATQNNKVRAIVMDFPEVFFTLKHHLLRKIKTYGFDKKSFNFNPKLFFK